MEYVEVLPVTEYADQRRAVASLAGIQQSGDIRVIEPGQDLTPRESAESRLS
jgi:hypothetical protein